jgi:hypothetical protein
MSCFFLPVSVFVSCDQHPCTSAVCGLINFKLGCKAFPLKALAASIFLSGWRRKWTQIHTHEEQATKLEE